MKPTKCSDRVHVVPRSAFTLVELLVVVTLIAVLLTLGASAAMRMIDVQRLSNTEQTLRIVSEAVDQQVKEVIAQANKETIPQSVRDIAGTDPQAEQRARVIYIKLRLRQEFPMTFAEALNPNPTFAGIPPRASYVRALTGITPPAPLPAQYEEMQSSICLLLALQQSRGGVTFNPDTLGSGAVTASPVIASGIPLKMLVDGWAQPLAFYRWPLENQELNEGDDPQRGFNDPVDPTGLLCMQSWTADPQWTRFRREVHEIPPPARIPRSYKLVPVVASAGRNGLFGIEPVTMKVLAPPRHEQHFDNIYSYRLRFGARGD